MATNPSPFLMDVDIHDKHGSQRSQRNEHAMNALNDVMRQNVDIPMEATQMSSLFRIMAPQAVRPGASSGCSAVLRGGSEEKLLTTLKQNCMPCHDEQTDHIRAYQLAGQVDVKLSFFCDFGWDRILRTAR